MTRNWRIVLSRAQRQHQHTITLEVIRGPVSAASPCRSARGRLLTGTAALAAVAAAATTMGKNLVATVTAAPTKWNQALLTLMPSATEPYGLPLLLRNGHVETIFASRFRKSPHLLYDREILHMPDGGCVCLDTEDLPPEQVGMQRERLAPLVWPALHDRAHPIRISLPAFCAVSEVWGRTC